jgi:transposase-like protein
MMLTPDGRSPKGDWSQASVRFMKGVSEMARASKFTDEQKMEIVLDMLSGKMSVSEVCRKWDIASTYAYKLRDRAKELLRQGIGRPTGRPSGEVERLRKKVADLEQLAGDQALVIHYFKKKDGRV